MKESDRPGDLQQLGGYAALRKRFRTTGIVVNSVVGVYVILGYTIVDRSWTWREFSIGCACLALSLLFMPFLMKFIMETINRKLVRFLDEGWNENTPPEEFDSARRTLLLNPWRATAATVTLWFLFFPPFFGLSFQFMSGRIVSLLELYQVILAAVPMLALVNLMAHDTAIRKFVLAFFPQGGVERFQSKYGVSVLQRLLFCLFLSGPYSLAVMAFLTNRKVMTSDTVASALPRLWLMDAWLGFLSICMFIALASYLRLTIAEPLRRVSEALKEADSRSLLPVESADDWAVVAERLNEKNLTTALLAENEARIRAIIEKMPVGLAVTSIDGSVEMINPALNSILGLTEDIAAGRNLVEILRLHQNNQEYRGSFADWCALYREPKRITTLRDDGEPLAAEVSIDQFEFDDEPRFLAIVADVTERHKLETMKQEFLAMISHDLRTPLMSVMSVLGIIGSGSYGKINEKVESRIKMAERNVLRLVNLVNDLLDLQRLESAAFTLAPADVAVFDILEASIESVQEFATNNQVIVTCDFHDKTLMLHADRERLIQVVVNLLSNAIKFSRGGTVSLQATKHEESVEIGVRDTGCGIADDQQQMIFERYRQADSKSKTSMKGTGLGLAICRTIIELHGGSIGVESKLDQGSYFWIRIPLVSLKTTMSSTLQE